MKNEEQLEQRHKDILRFILLARLLDFQYPTFYKGLKREMKARMNSFAGNLNGLLHILKTNISEPQEEYLDNVAAGAWEVLEEYEKAEDKAMFLAICQAYNAGGIQADTSGLPVNSSEFAEELKPKAA